MSTTWGIVTMPHYTFGFLLGNTPSQQIIHSSFEQMRITPDIETCIMEKLLPLISIEIIWNDTNSFVVYNIYKPRSLNHR